MSNSVNRSHLGVEYTRQKGFYVRIGLRILFVEFNDFFHMSIKVRLKEAVLYDPVFIEFAFSKGFGNLLPLAIDQQLALLMWPLLAKRISMGSLYHRQGYEAHLF